MRLPPSPSLSCVLLDELRLGFALEFPGIHSGCHWGCVRRNGLLLARESGADTMVVELFAVFHDSCRWFRPTRPGARPPRRGTPRGELFKLDHARLELLQLACRGHSDGWTDGNPTVVTCWGTDRFDLGREGVTPDPRYLCPPAACRPEILVVRQAKPALTLRACSRRKSIPSPAAIHNEGGSKW